MGIKTKQKTILSTSARQQGHECMLVANDFIQLIIANAYPELCFNQQLHFDTHQKHLCITRVTAIVLTPQNTSAPLVTSLI